MQRNRLHPKFCYSKTLKTNKKNCTNIFEGPIKILGTEVFFRTDETGSTENFYALTQLLVPNGKD